MFQGVLKKMQTEASSPVGYFLSLGNDFIALQQCLEHQLQFEVIGTQCVNCGGGGAAETVDEYVTRRASEETEEWWAEV